MITVFNLNFFFQLGMAADVNKDQETVIYVNAIEPGLMC